MAAKRRRRRRRKTAPFIEHVLTTIGSQLFKSDTTISGPLQSRKAVTFPVVVINVLHANTSGPRIVTENLLYTTTPEETVPDQTNGSTENQNQLPDSEIQRNGTPRRNAEEYKESVTHIGHRHTDSIFIGQFYTRSGVLIYSEPAEVAHSDDGINLGDNANVNRRCVDNKGTMRCHGYCRCCKRPLRVGLHTHRSTPTKCLAGVRTPRKMLSLNQLAHSCRTTIVPITYVEHNSHYRLADPIFSVRRLLGRIPLYPVFSLATIVPNHPRSHSHAY